MNNSTFKLGVREDGTDFDWGFSLANNFNISLIGESGSGKTYLLRKIAANIAAQGVTTHIFDIKDDFVGEKFVEDGRTNTPVHDLDFSYSGGDCGINPFRISTIAEGGGVYMGIQMFLEIVRLFNPQFSKKMDGYLNLIVENVYRKVGITQDDVGSWSKPPPTITDLANEVEEVLISLKSGMSVEAMASIGKEVKKLKKAQESAIAESEIKKIRDNVHVKVDDYIDSEMSNNKAYYRNWKLSSVERISETVEAMQKCIIFTRPEKGRRPGAINRYRLVGLSDTHKQIVMWVALSQIYYMCVAETIRSKRRDPDTPTHFAIFDEGKHAKQISKSQLSPLNKAGTEGRGYGLGVGLGIQMASHVTEDMLHSFGTRIVLHVKDASGPKVCSVFGVTKYDLSKVIPQTSCLISKGKEYELVRTSF